MKEIMLKLTDEEFDLLEGLRRRRPSECVVCEGTFHSEEGQHVLMADMADMDNTANKDRENKAYLSEHRQHRQHRQRPRQRLADLAGG